MVRGIFYLIGVLNDYDFVKACKKNSHYALNKIDISIFGLDCGMSSFYLDDS